MENKHGFWQNSLKSAQFVVAPMVDMSELAFRLLCRKHGAQLCYSPMLHSTQYIQDPLYRKDTFSTCPEDRPLIVQFNANDPDTFVAASRLVEPLCDAVDLNLGCPQAIARKGQYGAFLQDKWDLLRKILRQATQELNIPVTCKIRILPGNAQHTVEYARMLEDAGCSLLAIHGRTRDQKGDLTGIASWEIIKEVKQNISIPVFANGNILCFNDVRRCLEYTGVEGVMSAEGILHNPALFTGSHPYVWDMVQEYLDLAECHNTHSRNVRTHLFRLMHLSLNEYPALRKELAVAHKISEFREINNKVKEKLLSRFSLDNRKIEDTKRLFQSMSFNDRNENESRCTNINGEESMERYIDESSSMEYFHNKSTDYNLPIWFCHSRPRVPVDCEGQDYCRKPVGFRQNDEAETREQLSVSKNVDRKMRRHLRVLEIKKARRKTRKEYRKEKLEELRKSGIVPQGVHKENRNVGRERMIKAKDHSLIVCIDLSFTSLMVQKEQHRLASQLHRLYGANQRSHKPVHIYFTSFGEDNPTYKICCDKNDGFLNYVIDMTDKHFLDIFSHERIIYLTPDSPNTLNELKDNNIYIIGGLVDENINKNASLRKAESEDLFTARLPIEEYMHKADHGTYSKVLTVNQVFDILLKYYATEDWSESLLAGVPIRKGFLINNKTKEMVVSPPIDST